MEQSLTKEAKKTKYLVVTNLGPNTIRLASLPDELPVGYELRENERFVLDIDTNRPEYIELDKVYVRALGDLSGALVQVTYIEEI